MKINQTFPTHAAMVEAVGKYLADVFHTVRIKNSKEIIQYILFFDQTVIILIKLSIGTNVRESLPQNGFKHFNLFFFIQCLFYIARKIQFIKVH